MFVTDDMVFLQLQKTGGTHIAKLIAEYVPGRQLGKHNALDWNPGNRQVFASIRNPWDWYVSLWAYGCSGRGAICADLTSARPTQLLRITRRSTFHPNAWLNSVISMRAHLTRDVVFWRSVYRDPFDAGAFRAWLKAILSPAGKALLSEGYASSPLAEFAGLYTFRFLRIGVMSACWRRHACELTSWASVARFYEEYAVVDGFIRQENLEHDLASAMQRAGYKDIRPEELKRERVNASTRRETAGYHDEETIALIAEQDAFVVNQFSYVPPF